MVLLIFSLCGHVTTVRKEPFREAIAKVVNGVFQVRLPRICGEATTACASDSKSSAPGIKTS
jgi:TnpA family transposase